MFKLLVHITLFIPILHNAYGITEDEDYASVEETNPNFAERQAFFEIAGRYDPDVAATCGELIESRGFKYERYYVITADGYILQIFRIINPYAKESGKPLKPVLLLHPLLTSCSVWLSTSPGGHIKPWINGNPPNDTSGSLGFLLANLGFDVWIINVRGTTYSMNHTHLNSSDPRFWDFTFYEIAIYDVTATVGHIKFITGFEKIIVIGHSQGTIQLLIQLSVMPEFEENYEVVILAAPIGFLGGPSSFLGALPTGLLKKVLGSSNGPFPPKSASFWDSLAKICEDPIVRPACVSVFEEVFGYDPHQLNVSRASVYLSLLDQTSNKNLVHYFQTIERNQASYFDYGEEENYERYGSPEPPGFPFYRINPYKVILMSALNDAEATPINVQSLRNSLCDRVKVDHLIQFPYFNHADFLIAIEAYTYFGSIVARLIGDSMSRVEHEGKSCPSTLSC